MQIVVALVAIWVLFAVLSWLLHAAQVAAHLCHHRKPDSGRGEIPEATYPLATMLSWRRGTPHLVRTAPNIFARISYSHRKLLQSFTSTIFYQERRMATGRVQ